MQIILQIGFMFVGIFFIFFAIRGSKIVDWRADVRYTILRYNTERWTKYHSNPNYEFLYRVDSNDVLLTFDQCFYRFWLFGKYSMMKKII